MECNSNAELCSGRISDRKDRVIIPVARTSDSFNAGSRFSVSFIILSFPMSVVFAGYSFVLRRFGLEIDRTGRDSRRPSRDRGSAAKTLRGLKEFRNFPSRAEL